MSGERDPRVIFGKKHRERGPRRFTFTFADIAREACVSPKTARNAAAGETPELNPKDLGSVWRFIARRKRRSPGTAKS